MSFIPTFYELSLTHITKINLILKFNFSYLFWWCIV